MANTKRRSERPLSELLSAAIIAFAREAESKAGSAGMPPLATWANGLRAIGSDGVDLRELPARARISKRVVRPAVQRAVRAGWAVQEPNPDGGRGAATVRLTPRGREASDAWAARVAEVEAAWHARYGDVVDELRAALEPVVSQFDLELPHYPQSYGAADRSATGGVSGRWGHRRARRVAGLPRSEYDAEVEHAKAEAWEAETGGRLYVNGHGQDWRPVARDAGRGAETVEGLSLLALLSQAAMAITIDYEGSGGTALAGAATVLRSIGDDGFRLDAKEAARRARSGLVRHAYAEVVLDADGQGGTFRLNDKGRAARDVYRPLLATIEKRWERRYGRPAVRSLRASLEALRDQLDGDFPAHPFAR